MEEEDEEEDLGWKEEFAPCRSRKLPCYTIGRENVSKKFCIPNVLTALILSGDMGMLEYGFDHYKLENPVVCRGKIEALGEALLYGDETKRTGNKQEKKEIIMEGKTNERDSLKCNEPSRKRDF